MTCREFRQLVLIHPTIAESMPFLFDNLEELRNGDVESARRTDRDAAGQDAAARRESLDGEAVVHREPAPTGGEVTTKN
jgi:hypothetical protein